MRHCKLTVLIFLVMWTTGIYSQNKSIIGLSILADKASTGEFRPAFGVSFEQMLNKHHSAEIGLYYRTAIDDNLIVYSPSGPNSAISEQFFVLEKFISIPLTYNYHSNAVNIAIGPAADIYAGWKEKKHESKPPGAFAVPLKSYKFDHKVLWGGIVKVSRTFKLSTGIRIEPCIFFNPVFTPYSIYSNGFSEKRQYYGAALTAKFIL